MSLTADELKLHIASELMDPEPKGFQFDELVVRQDAALERLAGQLKDEDSGALAGALSTLLDEGSDGWRQLKLLELSDRLAPAALAPSLMQFAQKRASSSAERERFL